MRPVETRGCGAHAALDRALADQQNEYFPHKNDVLKPVKRFFIGGKWLNLYAANGRPPSSAFSFYWQDELNPVQHTMSWFEVLDVLSGFLAPFAEYINFDQKLAKAKGWVCRTTINCYKPSCTLGITLEEMRLIEAAGYSPKIVTPEARKNYIIEEGFGTIVCEQCKRNFLP